MTSTVDLRRLRQYGIRHAFGLAEIGTGSPPAEAFVVEPNEALRERAAKLGAMQWRTVPPNCPPACRRRWWSLR